MRRTILPFLTAMLWAGSAAADVSSWMFVGGGGTDIHREGVDTGSDLLTDVHGALHVDAGIGMPAVTPIVAGGVFHMGADFGFGTDFGAALRLTSRGYSRGDWGIGIDLGGVYRVGDFADPALRGAMLFGAPWGITVTAGGTYSEDDVRTISVIAGIDLARLTVHRTSGLNWFPSPLHSPDLGDAVAMLFR